MLARCTHCESTFVAPQFGRQRCPKCGTEVFIEDPRPGAVQPADPIADAGAPPPEAGQLSPWERRAQLGPSVALFQTIVAVLTEPGVFFSRLRYDLDQGGLALFGLIAVLP